MVISKELQRITRRERERENRVWGESFSVFIIESSSKTIKKDAKFQKK